MGIVPVRVGIISDDRLFAAGVARIVSADAHCVVDETGSDLLLLDARCDSALELCTSLAEEGRNIMVVGAPDDDDYAQIALDAGARGVLPKDTRPDDLVLAVRAVAAGIIWARRRVLSARIDCLSGRASAERNQFEKKLSIREREVFRVAVTGAANKELADQLAISEATVKVHLTRIFQKLGVRGRNELAAAYYGARRRYDGSRTSSR